MAKSTIVLAHGFLGFGSFSRVPMLVNYFNGVAGHLTRQGYHVIAPMVNPIGSVQERGGQLAKAILDLVPPADQGQPREKVHVIAHSMGGLDMRFALANVPDFAQVVATLVTIGTPHRGSPVADAIANPTDPLSAFIPAFILRQLEANAGALHDLTTEVAIPFDQTTLDAEDVRYIEVAGDASQGGPELFLFQLAAVLGRFTGEINDGLVTKSSALRPGHEHLEDWPVDHAGEVGWSLDSPIPIEVEIPFLPPPPHFARYDAIVAAL